MNRSTIIIALVLLSPFSIMLQGQADVLAVLVSSTTTQTVTSRIALTGTGATTLYQTFTQATNVPTTTGTTYTTSGFVTVPVPVTTVGFDTVYSTSVGLERRTRMILTTELVTQMATATAGRTTTVIVRPHYSTHYVMEVTTSTSIATNAYAVPTTRVIIVRSPTQVQGAVTYQYSTNVPTTLFSTSASTSTFATSQVVAVTATQTLTSVVEQSLSEMLSQNWWVLIALAAVLVVLAFSLGRRSRSRPPMFPASRGVQAPKTGTVYCMSCGAQNLATSGFCGKCGTKLHDNR